MGICQAHLFVEGDGKSQTCTPWFLGFGAKIPQGFISHYFKLNATTNDCVVLTSKLKIYCTDHCFKPCCHRSELSRAVDTRRESGQDAVGGSSEAVQGAGRPAGAGRADRKNPARSTYDRSQIGWRGPRSGSPASRSGRVQIGWRGPRSGSPASRSGRVHELAGDATWESW